MGAWNQGKRVKAKDVASVNENKERKNKYVKKEVHHDQYKQKIQWEHNTTHTRMQDREEKTVALARSRLINTPPNLIYLAPW